MVDEVGDGSGGEPVVAAVFEEVEDGHGGVGEVVHEEGLEDALGVVRGVKPHGEGLDLEERLVRALYAEEIAVDGLAHEVEGEVAQERAGVLGEEDARVRHCGPRSLNTTVSPFFRP